MKNRRMLSVLMLVAATTVFFETALAFQLSPVGTAAERREAKRWGITVRAEIAIAETALHNFSDPVHETLTQLTFSCGADWDDCEDPDLEWAGPYVIAGVRWNDDPVFKLNAGEAKSLPCRVGETISFVTQTKCWIGLFRDAELKSQASPGYFLKPGVGNYLSRSHFGDLQFLHAMAAASGETPTETQEKILMWAEFTWGVALGKYGLETPLQSIEISRWMDHFSNGQNVQDLLTLGRPWLRPHIREVAFGSLLHVIQDSFAEGHVQRREPVSGQTCAGGASAAYGAIVEFHSYAEQDHEKHKEADSADAAQSHRRLTQPNVITAGIYLRVLRDRPASWPEVSQYLSDCVFRLDSAAKRASAGDSFGK